MKLTKWDYIFLSICIAGILFSSIFYPENGLHLRMYVREGYNKPNNIFLIQTQIESDCMKPCEIQCANTCKLEKGWKE